MKLSSAQVQRTLGQFEARVIPNAHPVIAQLNELFGEHTFFLDQHGLNIVEPVEAAEQADILHLGWIKIPRCMLPGVPSSGESAAGGHQSEAQPPNGPLTAATSIYIPGKRYVMTAGMRFQYQTIAV
jgi:hypothetical protein